MTTSNPVQEMFDLWRKSMEEGTQAWLRAVGQAPPPPSPAAPPGFPLDFSQFWRPLLTQGMEIWQKAAAQGGLTPEFMQQWKGLMTQSVEAWSKALEQAMATEGFAQALSRYLDQWLTMQAPLRKGLDQYNDAALRTLGLPSRGQVVSLAQQVVALEERIEGLEDRLDELRGLVREVRRAVTEHEEAARQRAARPREGS
jgi:hypothetical protein